MTLGKISLIFFLILNFLTQLKAEDKKNTIPLVNLEKLKPSFEKEDVENKDILDKIFN